MRTSGGIADMSMEEPPCELSRRIAAEDFMVPETLPEECTEVYSADMVSLEQIERSLKEISKEQKQISREQAKHGQRIATLEGRIGQPPPGSWLKQNAYWIFPLLGSGIFSGALLTMASSFVDGRITKAVDQPVKDLRQLQMDVRAVSTKLDTFIDLEKARFGRLQSSRLGRAASNPTLPQNQKEALAILAESRQEMIPIARNSLVDAARPFIEAASHPESGNEAWKVAMGLASYRSDLNRSEPVVLRWAELTSVITDNPGIRDAFPGTRAFVSQATYSCDRAALVSPLGAEASVVAAFRKKDGGLCSQFLRFIGGRVPALDGNHFRNVAFEDVDIYYGGGPLILENVIFVNCRFHFKREARKSHELTMAILESTAVSFSSPNG